MKHLLSRNRRWKRTDRLYKIYGDFELYDIGPMRVHTNDIVGLSRHQNTIKNDNQMHSLKKSISEKGWHDEHYRTLHLVRMPDGKYTVGTGGNHRIYLAKELRIEHLIAFVSIFLPTKYLMERDRAEIKHVMRKHRKYNHIADQKNTFLQSKGASRKDYILEEAEYDRACASANKMLKKREDIFRRVARLNGLISKHDVALKTLE